MKDEYRKDIVLASSSPRRREMFADRGIPVRILPAEVDEDLPVELSPETTVMYLAFKKATWVAEAIEKERGAGADGGPLVIAADTVVVFGGEIIGKPADEDEAFRVLSGLRGNCHQVITGVALIDMAGAGARDPGASALKRCLYEKTDVYFSDYSDEDLRAYVATDEPYDKAGGYAIQETFGKYIDRIDGDRDNVIGFPMYRVEEYLSRDQEHKSEHEGKIR